MKKCINGVYQDMNEEEVKQLNDLNSSETKSGMEERMEKIEGLLARLLPIMEKLEGNKN